MKILKEEKLKYKKGFKYRFPDGTHFIITYNLGKWQVTGIYGTEYGKEGDWFSSRWYDSFKGIQNYLKKNFNLEIEK